jgi:hypothetical protein
MSKEDRYITEMNRLIIDAGSDPERMTYLVMAMQKGLGVMFLKASSENYEELLDTVRPNVKGYMDVLIKHHKLDERLSTLVA